MIDWPNLNVWILSDHRPGHLNPCLGVAEALGTMPQIHYPVKQRYYWFWRGICTQKAWQLPQAQTHPDIIIAAGWQMAHVSRALKQKYPGVFTVHLTRPSQPLADFDVIAMPQHDNPPPLSNIITTIGMPNRIRPQQLAHVAAQEADAFCALPTPRMAVLIGGNTRKFDFTPAMATDFLTQLDKLATEKKASLLVSTSRRTSPEVTAVVQQHLQHNQARPYLLWTPTDETANPYTQYLACADILVTTADSIGMTSEACSTGKPVLVWGIQFMRRRKFQSFYQTLLQQKYIAPLAHNQHTPLPGKMLDDTQQVAAFIKAQYQKK